MQLVRLTALLLLLSSSVFAAPLDKPLTDPAQEARAMAIGGELRCVVCQSESINDSQADMARDMRQLVRDKISSGWNDAQIIDYIRARYGDFILLRPPFQANTYILWLCPVLLLSFSGVGVWLFFRRKEKNL